MPLRPDLLKKLQEANTPPPDRVVDGLGDTAHRAVNEYNQTPEGREREESSYGGIDTILNPEARQVFQDAFDETDRLCERIGSHAPTPAEMVEAGIDLADLADEYLRMKREGLEPMVVIADAELNFSDASSLYAHLRQDDTIANNPLRYQSDGDGLWINPTIQRQESTLVRAPKGTPTAENAAGVWTVRVIAGTARPTTTGIDYHGRYKDTDPPARATPTHPTISEYLMLQARRIQVGQPPVDASTWTWLEGEFNAGSGASAPIGSWGAAGGRVGVNFIEVGGRDGLLGARGSVG